MSNFSMQSKVTTFFKMPTCHGAFSHVFFSIMKATFLVSVFMELFAFICPRGSSLKVLHNKLFLVQNLAVAPILF